jgi:hypothetical protein
MKSQRKKKMTFKKNGRCRHQQRHRPGKNQQRQQQLSQVERFVLAVNQQHGQGRQAQHADDNEQNDRVAAKFSQEITQFAQRRSRQNLANTRLPVLFDAAAHQVKANQRQKKSKGETHQRADPGGVEQATIAAQAQLKQPANHLVAQKGGQGNDDQEAKAAHPLAEVSQGQVGDGVHALSPGWSAIR